MFLIVGLGNPGKEYEKTRHNAGFMALDMFEKSNVFPNVRLLKPKTFMNNSGVVVKRSVSRFKLQVSRIIVIHDDIDIPLGKIKVSFGRGSAGHKGVESIIQALGTKNFTRIRVGIQPASGKPKNVETFVLKNFTKQEFSQLQEAFKSASRALETILASST